MLLLGIETSCDETAAAVVEDGKTIRSSIVSSQIAVHRRYGGVVPELASRKHIESIVPVVREGDQFELRGPIGGPFTWTAGQGGPLLLAGGGSGVVPLMSMLRRSKSSGSSALTAAASPSAKGSKIAR